MSPGCVSKRLTEKEAEKLVCVCVMAMLLPPVAHTGGVDVGLTYHATLQWTCYTIYEVFLHRIKKKSKTKNEYKSTIISSIKQV